MQHQMQVVVELLRELHGKAEAGYWGLEDDIKVGYNRNLASWGSTWCQAWLPWRSYRLACRHGVTCQCRQTGQAQELPAELLGS